MPIGILASLIVCTILYVAVAAVLTGMVSYKELDVAAPVALALDKYPGLHWLGIPLKLGAVAGMTSVMLVMTIAQARIFFAMARDGLLPPFFGRVHPRFRTPSTGTIVTGASAAIIGGLVLMNAWLLLAGFFIIIGAQLEDQGVLFQNVVDTVNMQDIMLTEFSMLAPSDTLEDALHKSIHSLQDDFPVVRGENMVGIISRQSILSALLPPLATAAIVVICRLCTSDTR